MGTPSLEEKINFFKQLDSLWQDSDSEDPDEEELALRNKSRAFFRKPDEGSLPEKAVEQQRHIQHSKSPRRTASEPTPVATSGSRETIIKGTPMHMSKARQAAAAEGSSFVEETPGVGAGVAKAPHPDKRVLRRSATNPVPVSPLIPSGGGAGGVSGTDSRPTTIAATKASRGGKRKRNSTGEAPPLPEAEQLFRGLAFFYMPNDDVAALRKMRIAKARQLGAQWVRSPDQATHIIVDKKFVHKDIEPFVGSVVGRVDSPVVVNEDYPVDCFTFRHVLNPDQHRYRVQGCPKPQQPPSSPPTASSPSAAQDTPPSPGESLQIKARPQNDPCKWDYVPPPGAPPRTPSGAGRRGNHDRGSAEIIIPSSQEIPVDDRATNTWRQLPAGRTANVEKKKRDNDPTDELSSYIELIAQYKDLPLENDDEDDASSSVKDSELSISDNDNDEQDDSEGEANGSEDERVRKRRSLSSAAKAGPKRPGTKDISWEDRFACNHGGTRNSKSSSSSSPSRANPNARTIEVLQQMCDYYTRVNDHWRTTAYRKAIKTLERQTARKITTAEEAARLPSVGPRLAAKIAEIAATDRLRRLEYARDEPLDGVLQLFLGVYGVGNAQALRWIARGFRTLEDLRLRARLTPSQRVGVERYGDLNSRIPRAEMDALAGHVAAAAKAVDDRAELLVGGSYRRGAESSGDIDFIVTRKGTTSTEELLPFLGRLVDRLTEEGFLVANVAGRMSGPGSSKWHGCCVLPPGLLPQGAADAADAGAARKSPVWRRIDFLLVPESEYGAALIYFTGNDIFNRSMRLLASKKGMRLNQRGLYKDVMRGSGRVKVTEGELVEGRDERRIFEILGVKWREPWERWC